MDFKQSIPDNVLKVMLRLENAGYSAYIVGGAVRDMLMGVEPHDYDIATGATPEEIKAVFKGRSVTFAEKFGTITVLEGGDEFEVTTFRKETGYSDSRHPDKVEWGKTIEEDLARRDFTINAMAMDKNGSVIDPFGGREDIKTHTIKCVGNPEDRFREDNLRILRAARFAALFDGGYHIEPETYNAICKYRDKPLNLSAERIRDELTKMITSCHPLGCFIEMSRCGILYQVLPEIKKLEEDIYSKYDKLVFEMGTLCAIQKDANLRIGYLLSFVKTKDAEQILRRLKFSNKDQKEILFYAKNAYPQVSLQPYELRRFAAENKELLPKLLGMQRAVEKHKYDRYEEVPNRYAEYARVFCEKSLGDGTAILPSELKINGNDLLELGFKGEEIKEMKDYLYEEVLKYPELNVKEKLVSIAKDYADRDEVER